jgi:hypothetical protein
LTGSNVRKVTGFERNREALSRGKALKGKPHERFWHETRPEGSGGSKPARGWETLEPEVVGRGKPEKIELPEFKR